MHARSPLICTILLWGAAASGEPAASPTPTPICVSIGFDLRGMPHRGPYDVDARAVESRRSWLATKLQDATPAPKPEIRLPPTPTIFTARFVPSTTRTAQARCEAAVAVVVPPARPARGRGRPDFRGPKVVRACAPCPLEPAAPASKG